MMNVSGERPAFGAGAELGVEGSGFVAELTDKSHDRRMRADRTAARVAPRSPMVQAMVGRVSARICSRRRTWENGNGDGDPVGGTGSYTVNLVSGLSLHHIQHQGLEFH
jgi:hypothetical protein